MSDNGHYGTTHRVGCGCSSCQAQVIADAVLAVRELIDDVRGMTYEAIVERDRSARGIPADLLGAFDFEVTNV